MKFQIFKNRRVRNLLDDFRKTYTDAKYVGNARNAQ